MDELELPDIRKVIAENRKVMIYNRTKNAEFEVEAVLSERQRRIVLAGGLLDYTREQAEGAE